MARRFVEVELGCQSVRLAQWERGHMTCEYTELLPEGYVMDGEIVSMTALGRFIKQMAGRYRLKGRHCRVILPEHCAYVRMVTLPSMKREQLMLNLPYEFRDFIRDSMDKYRFAYVICKESADAKGKTTSVEVLAAAVSRELLEEYRQMLRTAGWKMDYAAPAACLYADRIREMERRKADKVSEDSCFLLLRRDSTRLFFYKGSCLKAKRELEMGTDHLLLDFDYEKLGNQICQTLEFYQYCYPDSRLEALEISGAGIETEQFAKVLEEMTGIVCTRAEELWSVLWDGYGKWSVNLAKKERTAKSVGKIVWMLFLLGGFLGLFVRFAVLGPLEARRSSEEELARIQAELDEYRVYNADYEVVEKEYQEYYHTYLTEEELAWDKRYEKLKLVKGIAGQYGTIQSILLQGQECAVFMSDLTLLEVSDLAEALERQELVSHVEVRKVSAKEADESQTVTAELTVEWVSRLEHAAQPEDGRVKGGAEDESQEMDHR